MTIKPCIDDVADDIAAYPWPAERHACTLTLLNEKLNHAWRALVAAKASNP